MKLFKELNISFVNKGAKVQIFSLDCDKISGFGQALQELMTSLLLYLLQFAMDIQ